GASLIRSCTRQHVAHRVVSLLAGIFIDGCVGSGHGKFAGEGPRVYRWVVDGELIKDRVSVGADKAFGKMITFVGDPVVEKCIAGFAVKVRSVHDQGIALPMTARIAEPLANAS